MESKDAYLKARRKDRKKAYMEMPALVKEYDAAYAKAERRRPVGWMELPTTLRDREEYCDERGEPMVIELHTPIWGEIEAGFEWADDFHQDILDMGWQACEGVPAMYYLADARMATIVDDFLITESSPDAEVAERTIALMRAKYGEVTTERQPKSFYGCKLEYGADGSITISLPQKIIEAAREHLPGLIDGRTPKQLELLTGTALQQALDSLELGPARKACKDTTAVQSVTGSLKFSERVHTRLKLPVHRLGCVQSSPVDVKLALRCALSVLASIWPHRMEGRTWHPHRTGQPRLLAGAIHAEDFDLKGGSPSELESHADFSNGERQIIGELVTYCGAAVAASTTTLKAKALSTMEGEQGGTSRVLTRTEYGRIVARALGVPPEGPTFIGHRQSGALAGGDAQGQRRQGTASACALHPHQAGDRARRVRARTRSRRTHAGRPPHQVGDEGEAGSFDRIRKRHDG